MLLLLACGPATVKFDTGPGLPDSETPTDSDESAAETDSGGPDDTDPVDDTDSPGETQETQETDETSLPSEVDDFALVVDEDMTLLLHATWTDPGSTDAWVEYRYDGGDWQIAPIIGTGAASVLGIPPEREVEARAVLVVDGAEQVSNTATASTGTLPDDWLLPNIEAHDPSLTYEADYVMISVGAGSYTFSPPYQVSIFTRDGDIVWYYEVPDSMMSFYPTVAFDGTHIWVDAADLFGSGRTDPFVVRMTLDFRWTESLDVPSMGQAIAEGPDGSFYYEQRARSSYGVNQLAPDGSVSTVWDCDAWMDDNNQDNYNCYLNACNWNPTTNTILASGFYANTVWEVDAASGEVLRQMGQMTSGDPWTFDPEQSVFDYQHYPNWLDNGNLLVSTHLRGRDGVQFAAEYSLDDETQTLTRVWSYTSTDRWATQVGEATRLPNGNTVQGYGQDGAVREVTTDGATAWEASWELDRDDYRVVGHASFITDLYALNAGP